MTAATADTLGNGNDEYKKPVEEKTLEELAASVTRLQEALEVYWKKPEVRESIASNYERHIAEYFRRDEVEKAFDTVGWLSHFYSIRRIQRG
jgi:hypothetical protein